MDNLKQFRSPPIPKGEAGDHQRLLDATKRCRATLRSTVAQDPLCPRMGMSIKSALQINLKTGETSWAPFDFTSGLPPRDSLDAAMIKARPFMLKNEGIYYKHVISALERRTTNEEYLVACRMLRHLFPSAPFKRVEFFAANISSKRELLPPGVTNAVVGDRFVYSQVAHADDASNILDNIREPEQVWSYAAMVGDWIALISALETLIHLVCPEICPQVTKWAGDSQSINLRSGASKPSTASQEQ